MGLSDIWGEIQRFFVDASQYLAAGRQVDKYEKVVERLEKKIQSCQEKLDDVKSGVAEQTAQYHTNPGSAQGKLKTEYDSKVDAWETKHQKAVSRSERTLTSARNALQKAKSKIAYWEGVQEQEENSIRNRVRGKQEDERRKKEREREKANKT